MTRRGGSPTGASYVMTPDRVRGLMTWMFVFGAVVGAGVTLVIGAVGAGVWGVLSS